ncbi:MAG: AAA family ATPase, partial [Propionicimonas sp.]|nr:AAA family ATPase [Propionicimonas sp.]
MRQARRTGRHSVVIAGQAGVGKTRLAREALAEAEAAGAAVFWVRATASAAALPLAAVVDLLPLDRLRGDPLRAFHAGYDMLRERAGGRDLAIGVDDAHLLDPGSAAYVLHLARRGAFVLATVRAGENLP